MDISIKKMVSIIIFLGIIICILFFLVSKTSEKEEINDNETTEESYEESLNNILESIEKNDNVVVKSEEQTVTYEPKEYENYDLEKDSNEDAGSDNQSVN